ncbi:MAG: hypothetical protein M1813_006348 [Trichoglossum hirsutum]|nr:MAG: hypothetical protein M1813_006348 [Trichoglossum hirsutum]
MARQRANALLNHPSRAVASRSRRMPRKVPKVAPLRVRTGRARPQTARKTPRKTLPSTTGKTRRSLGKGKGTIDQIIKKYKRYCKEGKSLREIRKFQRSTDLLIPKNPFAALVKEILGELGFQPARIDAAALVALQEACEAFLVGEFENINLCAIHAKRVTIMSRDWALWKQLRRNATGKSIPGELAGRSS